MKLITDNNFPKAVEIAAFLQSAIGQMSGCITTESGRSYSEVVSGG